MGTKRLSIASGMGTKRLSIGLFRGGAGTREARRIAANIAKLPSIIAL